MAQISDSKVNTVSLDGNVTKFHVGFSTEIEKLQYGNEFNVTGEYLHTWNFGGTYFVSSFTLGPVGIDFRGFNVDSWQKAKTIKL